jgi:hypothetical protein
LLVADTVVLHLVLKLVALEVLEVVVELLDQVAVLRALLQVDKAMLVVRVLLIGLAVVVEQVQQEALEVEALLAVEEMD